MFSRCARRQRFARGARRTSLARRAGISRMSELQGLNSQTNAKPAFLSLAPLWQWLLDMERPGYDPFRPRK